MAPRSNADLRDGLTRVETQLTEIQGILREMREDMRTLKSNDSHQASEIAVLQTKVKGLEASNRWTKGFLGGLALGVISMLLKMVLGAAGGIP